MADIVIPETAVGNINGFPVALSGIYSTPATEGIPAKECVDVYIKGVLTAKQMAGDQVVINGERWEIREIQVRPADLPHKKGHVTFSRVQD